jgi:hypothetical protein
MPAVSTNCSIDAESMEDGFPSVIFISCAKAVLQSVRKKRKTRRLFLNARLSIAGGPELVIKIVP